MRAELMSDDDELYHVKRKEKNLNFQQMLYWNYCFSIIFPFDFLSEFNYEREKTHRAKSLLFGALGCEQWIERKKRPNTPRDRWTSLLKNIACDKRAVHVNSQQTDQK